MNAVTMDTNSGTRVMTPDGPGEIDANGVEAALVLLDNPRVVACYGHEDIWLEDPRPAPPGHFYDRWGCLQARPA